MGLFDWLFGEKEKKYSGVVDEDGDIVTNNGHTYKLVNQSEIPKWVWNQHIKRVKNGAETTSHKGKRYRYIIGPHDCWKRKRGKK